MKAAFTHYQDFAESLESIATGPSQIIQRKAMDKLLTKTPTTKGDLFTVETQDEYRVFDNEEAATAEFSKH